MKLKSFCALVLCSVLTITLLFSSTVFANASFEENKRVIRVAFPMQYGFAEKDLNDNNSGYTYEFLMKIAQRLGWEYEFVTYGNENSQLLQSLTDVEDGKVDLCGAMTYSDELAQAYEFTKLPYGYVEYVLLSKNTNEQLNYSTVHDYPNLKIALIESEANQNKLLENFCINKAVNYSVVYAKTSAECRQLVEQGKADAFISKKAKDAEDYKTLAILGKQPFYFVTNKKNSQLARQIDSLVEEINTIYPNYMTELYQKHFIEEYDLNMALTTQEREYLQGKPILRTSILENAPPWQYYDNEQGVYKGIIIDLFNEISQICDIKFEFVPVDNLQQAANMVKNGRLDIVSSLPSYFPLCDELNVWLTSPYMSVPVVYISNAEKNINDETFLISPDIAIIDKKDDYIVEPNVNKMFSLINSGKYKGAYLDSYSAQHNTAIFSNHNVLLTSMPYSGYSTSIAVSKQCDNRLLRILDQAIITIPKSRIESIIYENTTHSHKLTFFESIMRNPIQVIIIVAIFFSIIIGLLIMIFLRTKKLNKLISLEKNRYMEISQKDRLTNTYNNVTFKNLAAEYFEQGGEDCCGAFLVCDIDNFKSINDKYGHLEGDKVVSKLGKIMTDVFSEYDLVGRLGGDEMMALIKNTDEISNFEYYCSQLIIKSAEISEDYTVTLSIGVSVFKGKTNFNAIFKIADEALYEVKNKNKNGYKIIS